MTETNKQFEEPASLAVLALEALARYKASDLVHKGETMHEDIAVRLVRTVNRNSWS